MSVPRRQWCFTCFFLLFFTFWWRGTLERSWRSCSFQMSRDVRGEIYLSVPPVLAWSDETAPNPSSAPKSHSCKASITPVTFPPSTLPKFGRELNVRTLKTKKRKTSVMFPHVMKHREITRDWNSQAAVRTPNASSGLLPHAERKQKRIRSEQVAVRAV